MTTRRTLTITMSPDCFENNFSVGLEWRICSIPIGGSKSWVNALGLRALTSRLPCNCLLPSQAAGCTVLRILSWASATGIRPARP